MADATAFGAKALTLIKAEETFNTNPTPTQVVPVVSNGVTQTESERQSQFVLAGEADAYQTSQGTELWAGDVVVPFDSSYLPEWLDILFSEETPPDPWESLQFPQSFTMLRDLGSGISRQDALTGGRITRMALDWAPGGGPLLVTFGTVFAKNTPAASAGAEVAEQLVVGVGLAAVSTDDADAPAPNQQGGSGLQHSAHVAVQRGLVDDHNALQSVDVLRPAR
jgi:hypothetical protein